jgi:hypothetical protein
MHTFTCEVLETVVIRKIYTVEADTPTEAKTMLCDGETTSEVEVRVEEVIERDPDFSTLEQED